MTPFLCRRLYDMNMYKTQKKTREKGSCLVIDTTCEGNPSGNAQASGRRDHGCCSSRFSACPSASKSAAMNPFLSPKFGTRSCFGVSRFGSEAVESSLCMRLGTPRLSRSLGVDVRRPNAWCVVTETKKVESRPTPDPKPCERRMGGRGGLLPGSCGG